MPVRVRCHCHLCVSVSRAVWVCRVPPLPSALRACGALLVPFMNFPLYDFLMQSRTSTRATDM